MISWYLCALGFALINPFIQKKYYKYYLMAILAVLVYFAYHLKVTEAMDLYRSIEKIDLYAQVGWDWVAENDMGRNQLATMMYYGFSKLNNPMLYPAFTCFICYGSAFSILLKCAKRYDLTKGQMNWLLAIFCFSYYFEQAISNGRIYICYALISFFLYRELIEGKNKKTAWIIYVACCFLHYAAAPFLFFRIAISIKKRLKNSEAVIMLTVILIFIFRDFLAPMLGGIGGFFETMASKNEGYQDYTVFGLWQSISSVMRIGGFAGMCLYSYNKSNEKEKNVILYLGFVILMMVFMIGEYQLLFRTPNFLHYLGMIPMIKLMEKPEGDIKPELLEGRKFLQLYTMVMTIYTFTYQVLFTHPYIGFTF